MRGRPTIWRGVTRSARAMLVTLRRGFATPRAGRPALPFRGRPVARLGRDGEVLCTACGLCVVGCPTHCIEVSKAGEAIRFQLDLWRCMHCGLCASTCPVQAIVLLDDTGYYATALSGEGDERP